MEDNTANRLFTVKSKPNPVPSALQVLRELGKRIP
jgi:hypothetical protein